MKFSVLYRAGHSNYQSDFRSEAEFDEWIRQREDVVWAHLVEVSTGRYVKSLHKPPFKIPGVTTIV